MTCFVFFSNDSHHNLQNIYSKLPSILISLIIINKKIKKKVLTPPPPSPPIKNCILKALVFKKVS